LKLCGGFGYKPGYCVPIGGLSIETITKTAGWFSYPTYYSGGYCSYTVINDVFGVVPFGTESFYTGGISYYSIINFDVNLSGSNYYILSSSNTASL
jgi:hypothetical protein